ncbi:MAG: hypothetical protein HC799_03825 [Limnothrix sp. RL_2_0]|nr:hypothetical protein [Limnothrix sp. RL_2_0]
MSNIADTLIQAGLLNEVQAQVAMHDQTINPDMCIGEILSLRGWIAEETVDFFELLWDMRKQQAERQNIGQYFVEARLMTDAQVDDVLAEQKVSPLRFGEIAVLKGYVKQETVRFFVKNLFPDKLQVAKISPLSRMTNSTHSQSSRRTMTNDITLQQTEESVEQEKVNYKKRQPRQNPQGKRAVPPPPAPRSRGLLNRIKRQVQDKISLVNSAEEPPKPRKRDPEVENPFATSFDLAETEDIDLDQL